MDIIFTAPYRIQNNFWKKIKLLQGVVEERRLLQTYGFPFVEGPCFKKKLMVPRHMPIPTGIHSPSESGFMEPKYYMRFGGD